ncbi:MAG: hypothetical protein ACE3L7_25585 [Candidatus Pristimantibacillus sp.]
MNEIIEFAKILENPNLEQATIELVNATIRDMIKAQQVDKTQPQAPSNDLGLTPNVFNEWINGPGQERGGD